MGQISPEWLKRQIRLDAYHLFIRESQERQQDPQPLPAPRKILRDKDDG